MQRNQVAPENASHAIPRLFSSLQPRRKQAATLTNDVYVYIYIDGAHADEHDRNIFINSLELLALPFASSIDGSFVSEPFFTIGHTHIYIDRRVDTFSALFPHFFRTFSALFPPFFRPFSALFPPFFRTCPLFFPNPPLRYNLR
jgi:hypothetical protein